MQKLTLYTLLLFVHNAEAVHSHTYTHTQIQRLTFYKQILILFCTKAINTKTLFN